MSAGALAQLGCGPGGVERWPSFGDEGDATSGESSGSESSGSESTSSSEGDSESESESSESESESGPVVLDMNCPPGQEDCPCAGGACEPGLACIDGICQVAGEVVCTTLTAKRDARIAQCPSKPWVFEAIYGHDHDLRAEAWVYSGSLYYGRIFVDFDLAQVPPGSVVSATILLSPYTETDDFFHAHDGSPTNAAELRPVLGAWNEGSLNWKEQPELGPPIAELPATNDPLAAYAIDVGPTIAELIAAGELGHGFAIQLVDEQSDARLAFASDESLDPEQVPRLEVCVVQ